MWEQPRIHLKQLGPAIAIVVVVIAGLMFPVFSCLRSLDLDESLYLAAQQGDVPEMRRLIHRGADVNAKFDDSNPVLVAAIESGKPEAVQLLLDHHVDPNIIDEWQKKTATRLSKPYPAIRAMLLKAGGHD